MLAVLDDGSQTKENSYIYVSITEGLLDFLDFLLGFEKCG